MKSPMSIAIVRIAPALLFGGALVFAVNARAETPTPAPSSASKTSTKQSGSSDKNASASNPAAGLNPALPTAGVSRDPALLAPRAAGTTSKDPAAIAAGAGSSVSQAAREQVKAGVSDTKTQKPGFDQGFGTAPTLVGGSVGGNPVGNLTGGNAAGAAGAAAGGSGTTGIVGQGTGAISDGFFGGKKRNGADQVDEEKPADRTFKTKEGTEITVYGGGGFTINPVSGPAESYNKDNQKCKKGSSGSDCELARPVQGERGSPAEFEAFLKANPAVAAQLRQAQSGDGGRTDPGRGDSTAFSPGTAPLPVSAGQRSQSLVGQPGQAQTGGHVGNGSPGLNFNGNDGAIDPGPEATVTAGGRQQDPSSLFNDQPTAPRDLKSPNQDSSDDEDKDEAQGKKADK